MPAIPVPVPLTGPISINDIKAAFPSTSSNSYRDYEGKNWYKPSTGEIGTFPSAGPIDDFDFRGTMESFVIHISSNRLNVDLKSLLPYYLQGATGVLCYVDAGVKVGSSAAGAPAFVVNGFTSQDAVKIINNGFIKGAGGNGGGAGGYTSYSTVPVHAPVADPGNPAQTIPQPAPPDNPGLYGIYVRGTQTNQPTPVPGVGSVSAYTIQNGYISSDPNQQVSPPLRSDGQGQAPVFLTIPAPPVPSGYYVGNYSGSTRGPTLMHQGNDNFGYYYYYNNFELIPIGYFPKEYWVFRAGALTYHSVETVSGTTITRAIPPTDTLGNYQGNQASYRNDGTYIAAYDVPGITTQQAVSHAGSGSDSGENGGTALFLNYPTTVVNNGSIIGGGGGGGAGAGGSTYGGCCGCGSVHYSGGAGGGGAGYVPGNNATETTGGAGASNNGTTGGTGGNPGQAGQGSSGGGGGSAGYAIQNSGFVVGGVGSVGGTIIGLT